MIYTRTKVNPTLAPIPPQTYTMKEKLKAMMHIIPVLCLFLLVLGGIYAGIFTPTEAGAVGAIGALLITLAMGRLTVDRLKKILADSVRVTGMIMLIVIGAIYFSSYISTTGLPVRFAEILTGLQVNRYVILSGIYLLYLFLGCLMTPLSIIFMTLPVIYPVILKLGFDSIWFAIIVVKLCEIGCITPPVGLNVFVTRGVAPDVPTEEIFMGIGWFFVIDMVTLIVLTVFPDISLWLPSIMMGR
jgi:tripartite ATP-independent transporter DctM subunit